MAESEARKTIARATSSGLPTRPSGTFVTSAAFLLGVAGEAIEHAGVDRPGGDSVDAHTRGRALERRGFGDAFDVLADGVPIQATSATWSSDDLSIARADRQIVRANGASSSTAVIKTT